ncbi:MAG: FAD-dependent oxidoreductase, partial [Geminicoccaceae bacterium]
VEIGPVTAPNRFFAVPHATGHGFSQPQGAAALREMKAEGGWGTVSVQITEVSADSDMANHPIERLWNEDYMPAHHAQVERIKKHGSLAAIELAHGGMRARNLTSGVPVIGPGDLPILRAEIPIQAKAMDGGDIRTFRRNHRHAAQLAKKAGYDIIYVYAAHDISILSHFLSRRTNQRSDEYGGSLQNRVRLLREVLEDTLEVAAGECAVALRFAVHEVGTELALTHDGEGRDVVEMLAELPDLWDVNLSGWSADSATSRFSEEGFQLDFTDFVKSVTAKPVVGVGRFTSPDKMLSVIKSGRLDLIGGARPSIADPFLPKKIKEGRLEEIRECIGCNICVSMDSYGVPIRCTQNPTISEEWRSGWHPEIIPAVDKEVSTLIIGAGPAGLECAWTLARAGHHVTLADANEQPGGRIEREGRLAGLSPWRRANDYRVWNLQQRDNVDMFLASELAADDLDAFGADNLVIATGANWRKDGVGSTNFQPLTWPAGATIMTPDDIMAGAEPSGPMIVYDDDHFYMGSVIADELAKRGHEVRLVTPHAEISAWTSYTLEQSRIIKSLLAQGVSLEVNHSLDEHRGDEIAFKSAFGQRRSVSFACETLVFVGARLPDNDLVTSYRALQPNGTVHAIGDCLVPGTIQAAIYSGHRVARQLLADGDLEQKNAELPPVEAL